MQPAMKTAAELFCASANFRTRMRFEDMTHHLEVREREFAVLDIPARRRNRLTLMLPQCLRRAQRPETWKTVSSPSPAQPWMLPASFISSITMNSASMAGRAARGTYDRAR